MKTYILRRLLWAIPTLLGAVTFIFLIMRVLPGDVAMMIVGSEEAASADPAELAAIREQLGLNRPLYEQYFSWMWDLVRGDLGKSMFSGNTVWHELSIRLPYTLSLVVLSVIITMLVAIPVGVISALKQDTWLDYGLRSFAISGVAIPGFWLGMLMLMFTVEVFRWSPPLQYAPIFSNPGVAIQQLMMPALALGFRSAASSARMMRSSMLEVLREDYVRTARAKGLRERSVLYLHAMKNAILPVITIFGMQIIFTFGMSVIIERVFNVPGVGRLLVDSINNRDLDMVQGLVAILVTLVMAVNLAVDLIYAWIDPRIRLR